MAPEPLDDDVERLNDPIAGKLEYLDDDDRPWCDDCGCYHFFGEHPPGGPDCERDAAISSRAKTDPSVAAWLSAPRMEPWKKPGVRYRVLGRDEDGPRIVVGIGWGTVIAAILWLALVGVSLLLFL